MWDIMMLQVASSSPLPAALLARLPEDTAEDPLLSLAGDVAGSHALIVAASGPDLLCCLLRRGCLMATSLRLAEKPEGHCYDLVVAPAVASAECLDKIIRQANRALMSGGCLVMRVAGQPGSSLARITVRMLRLNGFTAISTRILPGEALVRAERPA
jgi:hypothetical protein